MDKVQDLSDSKFTHVDSEVHWVTHRLLCLHVINIQILAFHGILLPIEISVSVLVTDYDNTEL
jgi:hypothetical protein